jgi:hypothetical protein
MITIFAKKLPYSYSHHQHKKDLLFAIYFLNGLSYDKTPNVNLIQLRMSYILY